MLKKVGKRTFSAGIVLNLVGSGYGCAYHFAEGNALSKEKLTEHVKKFIDGRKTLVEFWSKNNIEILENGRIRLVEGVTELSLAKFIDSYYGDYISTFDKLLETVVCYDGDQFIFVNENNLNRIDRIFKDSKGIDFNFSDAILEDPFLLAIFSLTKNLKGKKIDLFDYKFDSLDIMPGKGSYEKKITRTFQNICDRYYSLIEDFQAQGSGSPTIIDGKWLTKVKEFNKNLVKFYSNKLGNIGNKKAVDENNINKEDDYNNPSKRLESQVEDFIKSEKDLLAFWENNKVTFQPGGNVEVKNIKTWSPCKKYALKEFFSKLYGKYIGAFDSILENIVCYVEEDELNERFHSNDYHSLELIDKIFSKEKKFRFSSFVRHFFEREYLLSYIFAFMRHQDEPLASLKISSIQAPFDDYEECEKIDRTMKKILNRFKDFYFHLNYKGNNIAPPSDGELETLSKLKCPENLENFYKSLLKNKFEEVKKYRESFGEFIVKHYDLTKNNSSDREDEKFENHSSSSGEFIDE